MSQWLDLEPCTKGEFAMLSSSYLGRWRLVLSLTGIGLFLALHTTVDAEVWKYVDATGVTQFTNVPPPQGGEPLFQSLPEPAKVSASAPAATASAALQTSVKAGSVPIVRAHGRALPPALARALAHASASASASAPKSAPKSMPAVSAPLNPGQALGDWPPRQNILKK